MWYPCRGTVSKVFTLRNVGKAALVITDIKVSCGCVSVVLSPGSPDEVSFGTAGAAAGWQAVIEPGRQRQLKITIDLLSKSIKPGKVTREVTIVTSDPLYSRVDITLEAEIKE